MVVTVETVMTVVTVVTVVTVERAVTVLSVVTVMTVRIKNFFLMNEKIGIKKKKIYEGTLFYEIFCDKKCFGEKFTVGRKFVMKFFVQLPNFVLKKKMLQ